MSDMNNISLGTSACIYLTLNGNRNFCFILCRYMDKFFKFKFKIAHTELRDHSIAYFRGKYCKM